jgi:hypothetical protein
MSRAPHLSIPRADPSMSFAVALHLAAAAGVRRWPAEGERIQASSFPSRGLRLPTSPRATRRHGDAAPCPRRTPAGPPSVLHLDQDVSLPACIVSNVPGAGASRLAFYVAVGSDGRMLPPAQVIRPLQLTRRHGSGIPPPVHSPN